MGHALNLMVLARKGRCNKVRNDADINMAPNCQVHLSISGPCAKFDRIAGSHTPATHPGRESPDGIRSLKQRDERTGVRPDRHDGVENSTSKYG